MIEEEHIYKFLVDWNSKYDPVRVQIFGKDPLLSLSEIFSCVQNEESRCSTMLYSSSQSQYALVSASQRSLKGDFRS